MEPLAVVERYLKLVADPESDIEEIFALLDPDIRFIEHPNLVNPGGTERDGAELRESLALGREMLREQSFEVVDHVVDGDRLAARVIWTGTLANGHCLRADSSMHFWLSDGRIVRQENYDCFYADETATRATVENEQ